MLTLGIQGLVEGESGLKTIELSYRQKKVHTKKFIPMVRELNRKGASRFSGKRRMTSPSCFRLRKILVTQREPDFHVTAKVLMLTIILLVLD
jgi:hypothetical protein